MATTPPPGSSPSGFVAKADKQQVVKALREVSLYMQIKGENQFKTRAYDLAADRISSVQDDVAELVEKGTLTDLPGIGESIATKISELVKTGTMQTLEDLRKGYPKTFLELLQVQDLGPKKAKVLFEQLGVGSINELEKACQLHQVRGLKGFGEKTEQKLLEGIELARKAAGQTRRRLSEVLPRAQSILERVKKAPGVVRASLGGSVRRMRETVADVDIIASAPAAEPVFEAFRSHPEVGSIIGSGDSKCSVRLAKDDLQIDLRVLPDEDFATALHHFTGSKAHHIRLRGIAQDQGLKLSEWGLHKGDEKIQITSEDQIYERLGLQPVEPELREDWGEIEAAQKRELPTDLVTMKDVVGNVHSHSDWSDGRNTLEEMALQAVKMGLKFLTVTEHSQTAGYAGGLKIDKMKQQWDEIDALNEKLKGKLKLLKGIESDILEDGRLDYPDEVLAKLDLVICSIHTRHSQNEEQMTKRVLAAMDNPFFMIWGHPTGRLLLKREPAPMKMEQILDKAAEKKIVIEVNGAPERLDLSAEHVRLALARKLKITVSSDSHSCDEVRDNLPLAVGTARKGWARKADVINTQGAGEFLAALRPH
jgi:DNA polymerase (family 10)